MAHAQAAERAREQLGDRVAGRAEHVAVGRSGVRERPEDVEDGPHPDLAPQGGREGHRRVERLGEHEAHARALDAARHLLGRKRDLRTECLEQVGRAGLRGHRAVAVLRHVRACCRSDKRRGGRDVEGAEAGAARAAGVEQGASLERDVQRVLAHDARHPDDLVDRLALVAQGDDERAELRGRRLRVHDLVHDGGGLVLAEVPPLVDECGDGFADHAEAST